MDRPHHWPPHSRCEVDRRYIILEKDCFDCTPVVASDGPLDWATRNAIQHTHTHGCCASGRTLSYELGLRCLDRNAGTC